MDLETELLRVLDGGKEPSTESEETEWSPMPFGRPAEPRPVDEPS
jgi:hypothetical protein